MCDMTSHDMRHHMARFHMTLHDRDHNQPCHLQMKRKKTPLTTYGQNFQPSQRPLMENSFPLDAGADCFPSDGSPGCRRADSPLDIILEELLALRRAQDQMEHWLSSWSTTWPKISTGFEHTSTRQRRVEAQLRALTAEQQSLTSAFRQLQLSLWDTSRRHLKRGGTPTRRSSESDASFAGSPRAGEASSNPPSTLSGKMTFGALRAEVPDASEDGGALIATVASCEKHVAWSSGGAPAECEESDNSECTEVWVSSRSDSTPPEFNLPDTLSPAWPADIKMREGIVADSNTCGLHHSPGKKATSNFGSVVSRSGHRRHDRILGVCVEKFGAGFGTEPQFEDPLAF